jgi:hypothetical protein
MGMMRNMMKMMEQCNAMMAGMMGKKMEENKEGTNK